MLRELFIKNVAVIEDVHISFHEGFNVLTGETGAGKSIIIDSINMILGERTSKDYVRFNQDRAKVQAVFDVNDNIISVCGELGVDIEDDCIILSRELTSEGKSTARINGMTVPLSTMRSVASLLVNIHGQHDNQALLSPAMHINFLDEYAKNKHILSDYRKAYNNLKDIQTKIRDLRENEQEKKDRAELLRFQMTEIEAADIKMDEEEELNSIREEILNAENIQKSSSNAYTLLYEGADGFSSAYDNVSSAISKIEEVSEYSDVLKDAYSALQDVKYSIEEVARSVRDYAENVEYDKQALDEAEQRLDLIGNIKRKYGGDVEKVLSYFQKIKEELSVISDVESTLSQWESEEKLLLENLKSISNKLSATRKSAAVEINHKITEALGELNMEQAEFKVQIEPQEYMSNGADNVQFLIKTNGGEPLKPLTKIASGGELSRTMLALKSILTDGVDALIFDEIDTGVSGMAAKKIAVKLLEISCLNQVLCITHLPQIASACDHHYLIEKKMDAQSARTFVTELDYEGRINEVARLTGGDVTQKSIAHAKELIDGCEEYKRRKRA